MDETPEIDNNDGTKSIAENTEVVFDGYPLLFPEKGAKELDVSSQVEDVGYWDFSETGGNSIAGGFDWNFTSNKEREDVLFHNGILDVPYIPGDSWGVSGSVNLMPRQVIDKSLDRDAFTLQWRALRLGDLRAALRKFDKSQPALSRPFFGRRVRARR